MTPWHTNNHKHKQTISPLNRSDDLFVSCCVCVCVASRDIYIFHFSDCDSGAPGRCEHQEAHSHANCGSRLPLLTISNKYTCLWIKSFQVKRYGANTHILYYIYRIHMLWFWFITLRCICERLINAMRSHDKSIYREILFGLFCQRYHNTQTMKTNIYTSMNLNIVFRETG